MTKEREELINRFQRWLDTNPNPRLIAAECANIAEQYHNNLNKKLTRYDCDIELDEDEERVFLSVEKSPNGKFVKWEDINPLPPVCSKCGAKIKRKFIEPCPTDGKIYCEKCIDPEGNFYNDKFFKKK